MKKYLLTTLDIEWAVCYNIRMSTTQNNTAETSRPCCACGADHALDRVRATPAGDLCHMCAEDTRADMCADAHERATGYEADDERPYGWDVPEEEYPDW